MYLHFGLQLPRIFLFSTTPMPPGSSSKFDQFVSGFSNRLRCISSSLPPLSNRMIVIVTGLCAIISAVFVCCIYRRHKAEVKKEEKIDQKIVEQFNSTSDLLEKAEHKDALSKDDLVELVRSCRQFFHIIKDLSSIKKNQALLKHVQAVLLFDISEDAMQQCTAEVLKKLMDSHVGPAMQEINLIFNPTTSTPA